MSAALEKRAKDFAALSVWPSLHFLWWLPELKYKKLRSIASMYIGRSLSVAAALSEDDLLRWLEQERNFLRTMTPNGIVVPKRDSVLEYNLIVKTLMEIFHSFGILSHVSAFQLPNIRIKFPDVAPGHMDRPRATEFKHTDAWVGEHPQSLVVHVPLFGDTENNYLELYEPPSSFEERWLAMGLGRAEEDRIRSTYTQRVGPCPKGAMYIMDSSVLHASTRKEGCGTRISLEASFIPVWAENFELTRKYLSADWLLSLGEKGLLYFPHAQHEQVDTQGSTKHPSNCITVHLSGD